MPSVLRRIRGLRPPRGTTHVVAHWPAFLLTKDTTGGQGFWEIETLANFQAGTPADGQAGFDGPDDVSENHVAAFARDSLGYPVTLDRFEIEVEGVICPAFHVTPKGR